MKFFVPAAGTDEQAERVYSAITESVGAPAGARRIRKIEYTHNGIPMVAEVGQQPPAYYRENGPVVAIIDDDPIKMCLPDRGVVRGDPVFIGASTSNRVEYFD